MKFKRLLQLVLVSGGILALSACQTPGTGDETTTAMNESDASNTQVSSLNQGDIVGGAAARKGRSKSTYYFAFDSSNIRQADKPSIASKAAYLSDHSDKKVTVEGHTDPRGSREYNVALGERRANAVADLLRSSGADAHQVRVMSYGAQRLATSGRSERNYKFDRRAVIINHG